MYRVYHASLRCFADDPARVPRHAWVLQAEVPDATAARAIALNITRQGVHSRITQAGRKAVLVPAA